MTQSAATTAGIQPEESRQSVGLQLLLFQGVPLFGLALAGGLSVDHLGSIAAFLTASGLLFGHLVVLRQWGRRATNPPDLDPAGSTAAGRDVSADSALVLAMTLGLGALAALAWISPGSLVMGAVLVALSAVYSHPRLDYRAWAPWPALSHFFAGGAQFLMGFAVVSPLNLPAYALGLYFALALSAGYLLQELLERDTDLRSDAAGPVGLGPQGLFLVSAGLSGLSYAYVAGLATMAVVPQAWTWLPLLAAPQLLAWGWAWSTPLATADIRRYQTIYRLIFASTAAFMLYDILTMSPDGRL